MQLLEWEVRFLFSVDTLPLSVWGGSKTKHSFRMPLGEVICESTQSALYILYY